MRRLAAALLALCACTAVAQTGSPLWGSFETSSFDTVNRQNLNVHLTIPLVSAPSRAGAFNYTLGYDSLIWTNSGTAWTPVTDANGSPTWGWQDNYGLGTTAFNHHNGVC